MDSEEPKRNWAELSTDAQFLVGLVLALVIWGLQLIGITINLWLGAIVLAIAFVLMTRVFWIREGLRKRNIFWRVLTVCVAAILYAGSIAWQIRAELRKEHPVAIVKSSEPPPTVNPIDNNPPSAIVDSRPHFHPKVAPPKAPAAPPARTIQQNNSGGTNILQGTNGDQSPIINSPIVVNPGPPAPTVTVCISEPQIVDQKSGEMRQVYTLRTSNEVAGPAYKMHLSDDILEKTNMSSPDMMTQMSERLLDSKTFIFRLLQTWYPPQRINVEVHWSGKNPKLESIEGLFPSGQSFTMQSGNCNSAL